MKYLILLLLISCTPAHAAVYLEVHGLSKHFNTTEEFNEVNSGIGISFDIDEHSAVSTGVYKNSLDGQSVYLNYAISYPVHKYVRIGLITGMVTGYFIPLIPTILPIVVIGDENRFQFGALPAIKNITPAVVFMSYQRRLW